MGDQTVEKQWQQHHLHLHRTNLIEIHGWGVIMTVGGKDMEEWQVRMEPSAVS